MVRILDPRLGIGLHGKLSDVRRADRVWEVLMRAWAAYAVGRRSWYESGGIGGRIAQRPSMTFTLARGA
jgi:hypothetical protein